MAEGESTGNRPTEEDDAELLFYPTESASPTPLLRLLKKKRRRSDAGTDGGFFDSEALADEKSTATAAGDEKLSHSPYVTLQWFPFFSSPSSSRPQQQQQQEREEGEAVEIELYTVRPSRSRPTEGGFDTNDMSRTTSLAGTFTFRGLRRFYGLPGARARAATAEKDDKDNDGDRSTVDLDQRFAIPRDGFRYLASVTGKTLDDWTNVPGVLPLFFAELAAPASTGDAADGGNGDAEVVRTVGVLWMSSAPFSVRTKTLSSRTETVRLSLSSSAAETRVFSSRSHARGCPSPVLHADGLSRLTACFCVGVPPPLLQPCRRRERAVTRSAFPVGPVSSSSKRKAGQRGQRGAAVVVVVVAHANAAGRTSGSEHVAAPSGVPTDSIGYTGGDLNQRLTPFSWSRRHMPDPMRLQTNLWLYGRRFFFTRTSPHIPVIQSSPLYQEGKKHAFFVSVDPDEETWYTTYPREAGRALLSFSSPSTTPPRRPQRAEAVRRQHKPDFVALTAAAPDCLMEQWGTLPPTTGHIGGTVHRQVHNAYSVYYTMAAFDALWRGGVTCARHAARLVCGGGEEAAQGREADKLRPEWRRLRAAIADVVALSLSGLPFVGNVAGFEVDWAARRRAMARSPTATTTTPSTTTATTVAVPSSAEGVDWRPDNKPSGVGEDYTQVEKEELLVRWYQAATIFPFMRAEEGRGVQNAFDAAEVERHILHPASSPPQPQDGEAKDARADVEAQLTASVRAASTTFFNGLSFAFTPREPRGSRHDSPALRADALPLHQSLAHKKKARRS
ncbi:neutral alpha-glucosidase C-like [Bactrocera neohumeralis]|uniref:neutral alpha-glucosidase C-like n=1 Tax=Bactrocera neohumeralis TaxID=98809 RepID=UPI0021661A6C|nr:neutral alpha-glucosidase C-like [Bactrocera neohumeralis]